MGACFGCLFVATIHLTRSVRPRAAEGKSKRPVIVTTLCDSGQRGISKLYSDDYLAKAGLLPWEDEASRSIVLNSVDFVS